MILILDIARGLAALWVFIFHAQSLFEESSRYLYYLAKIGHLGVPMFFSISGYVITYSAESNLRSHQSALTFLKNRFLRIYPAFWASVVVVLLIPYVVNAISMFKTGSYYPPEMIVNKFNATEWGHFFMLTKVFFAETNDLQGEFNTVNSVYWTLAIEFQFYLIIFVCLLFRKYYHYLIITISLIAFFNLIYPFGVNYGLFIHYWPSFSFGILLAYIHKDGLYIEKLDVKNNYFFQLIVFMSLMMVFMVDFSSREINPVLFSGLFVIILWLMTPLEKKLKIIKKNKRSVAFWVLEPFLIIGAMSFSIYLLHGKLVKIPNMFIRQLVDSEDIANGLLTILFTLLFCFPFYFFIERRFMSKNYKKLQNEVLST